MTDRTAPPKPADDATTLVFGRRRASAAPDRGASLLVLLVLGGVTLMAATRSLWSPAPIRGSLIEVVGAVPEPGMYAIEAPTVAAAIAAAGGDPAAWPLLPPDVLNEGDRVDVQPGRIRILPPSDPLLVALPIQLNEADATAFAAIPGIGRKTAEAIVADRRARGPFRGLQDLTRVSGVGASALDAMSAFVVVEDPGPIDINVASAARLELLPRIGPVLAARIVVDRADGGPYATLDDLGRVEGVGPATLDGLRGLAVVAP